MQVLTDPAAHYKGLVWDGRYAWLNSERDTSITVVDGDGHVVTEIGLDRGLPRSDSSLVLYPLSEGRILAAGAAMKRAATSCRDRAGSASSSSPKRRVFDSTAHRHLLQRPRAPHNWTTARRKPDAPSFPAGSHPGQ